MGFFSSLVNGISNFVSEACSIISSAFSSIGSSLVGLATTFLRVIPMINTLPLIITAIKFVAEALGLLDTNKKEEVEEIGAKAFESEKKPEDFDTTKAYIEHLRKDVEFDRAKFENLSEEKKLACTAVGAAILSKGISEANGIDIPMDFWSEVGKQNMKAEEVKTYIDNFKAKNLDLNLSAYLKGDLSVSENRQLYPVIESTLKQLNPDLSAKDIESKLFNMRQISKNAEV